MNAMLRSRAPGRSQRGLSLVELMVGITVGLFVVAAAATVVANQLGDNRRLLLETQVQQDLRSTMDIITRQLRRAGSATPADVQAGMAASSPTAGGAQNPFREIEPASAAATETTFSFYFDASQQGPYGFKLEGGVVKSLMPRTCPSGGSPPAGASACSQWQELTDPNTMEVTAFSVTPRTVSSTPLPCPKLCPADPADPTGQYCWPKLVVRSYVVDIQARSKSDPGVQRALRNDVRVRNDLVQFNGPGGSGPVCPA